MKIVRFNHVPRGTLVGFASIELDSGLILHGVTLHKQNGARWTGMPGAPQLDKCRQLVTDDNGKVRYSPVAEIQDKVRRDGFSKQAWDALERYLATNGGNLQ